MAALHRCHSRRRLGLSSSTPGARPRPEARDGCATRSRSAGQAKWRRDKRRRRRQTASDPPLFAMWARLGSNASVVGPLPRPLAGESGLSGLSGPSGLFFSRAPPAQRGSSPSALVVRCATARGAVWSRGSWPVLTNYCASARSRPPTPTPLSAPSGGTKTVLAADTCEGEGAQSAPCNPAPVHQRLPHLARPPSLVALASGLIVKPFPRRQPHVCLPPSWDQLAALVCGPVPARVDAVAHGRSVDLSKRRPWPARGVWMRAPLSFPDRGSMGYSLVPAGPAVPSSLPESPLPSPILPLMSEPW
ncbi:hypothetical protein K505DRAFT_414014 [Melanomma pulvis-pyrius CBS 109.77]|uniref:Uncharacterized protein n=1 Tax=Melanomma pulvis-pyrius CBS 109.77 TaxID=1314802 RepID=A0A6A6XR08_9PLEO|nr:hypothetical protein K505DRAFT_414014 [Melanomma pulvis-pyrius CBS 109.77]